MSVDFYNKDDDILDPYSHLHAREEALVSENPLQVSPAAMFLNIRNVFSQSKLARTNEKASESWISLLCPATEPTCQLPLLDNIR